MSLCWLNYNHKINNKLKYAAYYVQKYWHVFGMTILVAIRNAYWYELIEMPILYDNTFFLYTYKNK